MAAALPFNMQRRPSSWFGPQFRLPSFSIQSVDPVPAPRPSYSSSRGSFAEPRRSSTLRTSTTKLPMPEPFMLEPLFHDSYLSSEDDISPTTPDPKLSAIWGQDFVNGDYFMPHETLEQLGLGVDQDDCADILATYVSIVRLGKPKIVDIPPPSNSREQSPRPEMKPAVRPPIVWRMPSYDSTTRTSEASYPTSERTDSFDSRSTYASSLSDGPKTPSSFTAESLKVMDSPAIDPSLFPEPGPRGSISRSSTQLIRRHSRNLSASFSKAFLNRVREADSLPARTPSPPSRPSTAMAMTTQDPVINYSLPYSATRRPNTPEASGATPEPHLASRPQHLTPFAGQAPVLRRKKSIAGSWF